MKRILVSVLLLGLSIPCAAGAQEIIKKGELLTLDRAISIAVERHPNIIASRNSVDAAQSRVGQARANYYPQLDMSAGYSRVKPASASQAFNAGSSSFNQYVASLSLSQNIYDFGTTKTQIDIQSFNLEASRDDLGSTTDTIIFNVKQAYFNVLKTRRTRDVAEETVSQFVKHLDQAKGFYEVGTKPKFDVTKAEVDLSTAKLNLIRAENAQRVAITSLNNALGIQDAPEYMVEDNLSFQKYAITFGEAIERAYANRPDLKAVVSRRIAAEKAVALAEKGYYPFLTGTAGYSRTGESFPLQNSWSVGATLSFPIFSGYLTKNQVAEARANLEVAKANEEAFRQNIFLEVKQDYLGLAEAEERVANTELTVKQATENLDIANGRYAAGVGNPIEVTDAEVSLSNAKTEYIGALYDYRVSRASIEKALGLR